ncbi:hypothetical protein ACIQRZ_04535 [Streptomyces rubiginosohelvolus]|uniref:hypothetical protein n=2 Tax=Streptomyces TaxID=1883 RepID=UPI0037F76BAA
MGVESRGSWSGWRDREVRISDRTDRPTLLEVRGGLTSNFRYLRMVDSRSTGTTLVTTTRGRWMRIVLPVGSSGFSVERFVAADGAGGFHRWQARTVEAGALPTLTSEEREGELTETFGYFHPKRYYEERHVFRYEFEGHGSVTYHPETGGSPVEIPHYPPRPKGTIPMAHHGYITISSPDKWRVSIV